MMLAADDAERRAPHRALSRWRACRARLRAPCIFETVRITAAALRRDFGIAAPRIAVAGLNPHAGEGGPIGREEIDVIAPGGRRAARRRASRSPARLRPTPCSTPRRARAYDAAIAMYHDQALIPVKTLAFGAAST